VVRGETSSETVIRKSVYTKTHGKGERERESERVATATRGLERGNIGKEGERVE
jgi:hypothetical protein